MLADLVWLRALGDLLDFAVGLTVESRLTAMILQSVVSVPIGAI